MLVVAIDGLVARCEAKGIERNASLFLLQHEPIAPGDFVTVYKGEATSRITETEARAAWQLYDEMLAASADT
jgi:hydrogenase expression/formation protein HypC